MDLPLSAAPGEHELSAIEHDQELKGGDVDELTSKWLDFGGDYEKYLKTRQLSKDVPGLLDKIKYLQPEYQLNSVYESLLELHKQGKQFSPEVVEKLY